MKKSVLSVFCFIAMNAVAQMEVVDVETMTTYNTKIIEHRGDPAIALNDANIIPTSQDAHDAVNQHSFGKWKLYTGPAYRGEVNHPSLGLVSAKVCANLNNVPCMLVRSNSQIQTN